MHLDGASKEVDPEVEAAAPSGRRLSGLLGPGLIAGASDDDPSGIATYSQAGARFGYDLAWTILFTYPLMTAVQMISARIGRTTGHGLAGNLRRHYPNWLLQSCVLLLLFANIVNIGADLGAMADALVLVVGGPPTLYVLAFGAFCAATQVFVHYGRYVGILKWLTLALLAYVATLFLVEVPWGEALARLIVPRLRWEEDYLTMIVAVLGTTISPYLFFWQASQESEDVRAVGRRRVLRRAPQQGRGALARIEFDTLAGMGISNLVALAVMATTAATLHAGQVTDIGTSAEAAEALRPFAGDHAATLFALGIVGTGLLAVPVLAGSAAYALGEARQWPVGLARRPMRAKAFYVAIVVATMLGALINLTPIDPIRALYWAAVVNGIVAVPVMAVMMLMASSPRIMGEFAIGGPLKALGWLATAAMAAAVVAMAATWL